MIQAPMDVLKLFPVRKTKKQKQAFRESVISYLSGLGYPVKVEKGSMGCQNVVIGEAEKAKYLVTAHYDTPAGMILPNFLTPCNLAAYLVYQILLVIMLFAFAFVVSFCAACLTDSYAATALSAYVAYFGVLLLMLFGPANKNNANDNTSGVVTVLEMARTLPEGDR